MKKLISILLVLTLSLSVFGGCSKKDTSNGGNTSTKKASTEKTTEVESKTEKLTEEDNFLCSDKPLELTIFEFTKKPFKNDYPVFVKAAEMTNIHLKGVVSESSSDSKQAFNLMVASGEMADIIAYDRTRINELALEGAFAPLGDLIAEHAPNLHAFFEAHPDVKKHATASDGKIYIIPFIADGDAAQGWFVREDWLETLGLEQPKTIDELYNVLKAFKEQDPNGNGKADEIPFFNRDRNIKSKMADFALLWGAYHDWYVEDGQVKYGPFEPAHKTAYENIANWYAEGLIDNEIYTRGKTARDVLLKDNLGGMTHDWFGSTSGYNDKVDVEGFKFTPFAPPANIDGQVIERTKRLKLGYAGWGVSASNKHLVETIKYFDFFFTEEGRRLMNFGIEGETYTMVDGEPIFMDNILNAEVSAVLALREYGCQTGTGFQQDFNYEKQWMNKIAFKGVDDYMKNGYFMEQFPRSLPYTPEEKERLAELMVAIETLRDETMQKWVLGAEEVSVGYDNYITSLKNFKIEEAIAIQQAAYDRFADK